MLWYRRKLKPRHQIEFSLGVMARIREQRTIRAQRRGSDDTNDMRKPPAPLARKDDAHVPQRRIGIDPLIALAVVFLKRGALSGRPQETLGRELAQARDHGL